MTEPTDPVAAAHGMMGATPKERDVSPVEMLLNQFETHEREEMTFVEGYRAMVRSHKNPMVKFLLDLVIADEEKHHAVVHAMASSLRADLAWSDKEGGIGGLGEIDADEKRELRRLTSAFIKEERKGIKECRALAKAAKGYYQGSFALLIETIIHDSEKHLMILEFLEKKLKEA